MADTAAGRPDLWISDDPPQGAIAAATLILLRDAADGGPPDLLMLQRAATMRFAAGAMVFPGGRVDDADVLLARSLSHALSVPDAAARIASIRETVEEAGVAVGLLPAPLPSAVDTIREALHRGEALGGLLEQHGLYVDFDALDPFSRWCPGAAEGRGISRVFDTRFYVARAPQDADRATVDTTENVRLRWATAAQVIADCDAGREAAIYPTLRNLERLALGDSHAAIVADARRHPVEMVIPWVEERDGERHLCIPDHLGYPILSQAVSAVRRG